MTLAEHDCRIDYIEFKVPDIEKAKAFYAKAFGWKFTDYGPDYTAFEDGRLTGGFHLEPGATAASGNPLVVIYAADLSVVERSVTGAGAVVTERHEFPGGRRFHFRDPVGNTLAVWTDR
jgi:hypothetical protein